MKINECFADFYADIYRSQGSLDFQAFDTFFENLDSVDLLDEDINLDEITQVISSFPNNKAPGPDGFILEFFKTFSLSPLLVKHMMLTSGLQPTLYKANISLIPKPGCDPRWCHHIGQFLYYPLKPKPSEKFWPIDLKNLYALSYTRSNWLDAW